MATTLECERRISSRSQGKIERTRDWRRQRRASQCVSPFAWSRGDSTEPARTPPSKASDSSLFEYFGHAWSGSAVDDSDQATPTLESTRGSLASAPVNPLLLPDSFRHARADVGTAAATESKRLSISSFVSAISNRGYSWSGKSSVAGSEPEGTYVMGRHGLVAFSQAHGGH